MVSEPFERFLYYPDRIPPDMPPPPWTPAGAGEVWMESADGTSIHGLWWDGPANSPAVLFLHGNAQEVYSWSLVREDLAATGARLLIIDYRGYGKSGGEPSEEGLYMDGRAALEWLEGNGVPGRLTFVFGKSLGGGVACEIARGRELAGLVLESTFTSLSSVARNLFPFARGIMGPDDAYESIKKLPEISCGVLVVHGEEDALIPFAEGLELYRAVRGPREMYAVEGAGHNDVAVVAGAAYGRRIAGWIEDAQQASLGRGG